jgi:hypothetical protein
MNYLQKWFELIAGITQEERDRREFAEQVFARRIFDAALQTPACWRRRSARNSG